MKPNRAYYESLPAKRMGAGCLFFNVEGQVMLVKPTYKPTWEIPGGIVERNESPKQCCQREVREELGFDLQIGNLLVVDYNSETDEKTESLMFIFYGGVLSTREIESIRLKQDELSEFHFFSADTLPGQMPEMLQNRVLMAWQQIAKGYGIYLENQKF